MSIHISKESNKDSNVRWFDGLGFEYSFINKRTTNKSQENETISMTGKRWAGDYSPYV
jgi:hypothetical protein